MRAWRTSLPALLLAACAFSAPQGPGDDPGDSDGDGDGGNGGPTACADDDRDTVCNTADKCAGHDDRMDVDTDGSPDGCDDWPCGVKPDDPGGAIEDSGDNDAREWSAAFINIGADRRAVARPGQQLSGGFGWGVKIDCPSGSSCRAQVEIGFGTTRAGCIYDNTVNDNEWRFGGGGLQLTAPATPGTYELRLNGARAASCGTGTTWFGGDPGAESTIAIVCVR
jgi:hypothetical protein